ncbi:MAG: CBS domain-containing protein, partial [Candidatus Hodarchaeota archaeon]
MDSRWPKIEEVAIIDKNQPVAKAISFLQEGHDIVIVVDERSKFEGMIRTHDVVGKGINLTALCKTYENRNIPTILEEDIKNPEIIGEMMIIGGTRYIPVLDKHSKVKGAIKDLSVLSELASELSEIEIINTIKEAANWELVTLQENDTIGNALAKIREYGFSRIPIINSLGELEGVVINRSLLRTNVEKRTTFGDISGTREKNWHLLPVKDFMFPAEFVP